MSTRYEQYHESVLAEYENEEMGAEFEEAREAFLQEANKPMVLLNYPETLRRGKGNMDILMGKVQAFVRLVLAALGVSATDKSTGSFVMALASIQGCIRMLAERCNVSVEAFVDSIERSFPEAPDALGDFSLEKYFLADELMNAVLWLGSHLPEDDGPHALHIPRAYFEEDDSVMDGKAPILNIVRLAMNPSLSNTVEILRAVNDLGEEAAIYVAGDRINDTAAELYGV